MQRGARRAILGSSNEDDRWQSSRELKVEAVFWRGFGEIKIAVGELMLLGSIQGPWTRAKRGDRKVLKIDTN